MPAEYLGDGQVWDTASFATASSSSKDPGGKPVAMRALTAVAAHDKDVNAVAVSPNDAFAVSASQDRTAKVCDELYEYTWG